MFYGLRFFKYSSCAIFVLLIDFYLCYYVPMTICSHMVFMVYLCVCFFFLASIPFCELSCFYTILIISACMFDQFK